MIVHNRIRDTPYRMSSLTRGQRRVRNITNTEEIDSGRIDLPTPITGQRLSSTNPAIFEHQKSGDMSGWHAQDTPGTTCRKRHRCVTMNHGGHVCPIQTPEDLKKDCA